MNKIIANEKLLKQFSNSVLPVLADIKGQLDKNIVPGFAVIDDAILLLNNFVEQREQEEKAVSINQGGALFDFEDNKGVVTKSELKVLTAPKADYLNILSRIGYRKFVDDAYLVKFKKSDTDFLIKNKLLSSVKLKKLPDSLMWALTTKGWQLVKSDSKLRGILPDFMLPIRSSLLPTEWTEGTYVRIKHICDFYNSDADYIVSFIDEQKQIPFGCFIADYSVSEKAIVVSLTGNLGESDLEEIKRLKNMGEGSSVTMLVSDSKSDKVSGILESLNNIKLEIFEVHCKEERL